MTECRLILDYVILNEILKSDRKIIDFVNLRGLDVSGVNTIAACTILRIGDD